jgi:phage/plasmid-associated DNA primase
MADVVGQAIAASFQELDALRQANYNLSSQRLSGYLKSVADCVTERGSAATNIIDQGARVTYSLADDRLAELYVRLEDCRRSGAVTHCSERQGAEEQPYSGLMLDFDIALKTRPETLVPALACGGPGLRVPQVLDERAYRQICTVVTKALAKDLVLPKGGNAETQLQFFFTVRPETTAIASAARGAVGGKAHKYGFHLLAPGVQITRSYKKYLITELRKNERLLKVLAGIGAVGAPGAPPASDDATVSPLAACLDQNSASVPVLFLGSCKRGGKVYPLGAAFKVQGDDEELRDGGFTITPISEAQLAGHNLCHELSLWARTKPETLRQTASSRETCTAPGHQAIYDSAPTPLVAPRQYKYQDALATSVETLSDRLAGTVLSEDEYRDTEAAVEALGHQERDARYLQQMLSLLDETYFTEYPKWRNVVFALNNSGKLVGADYLPLAKWFSQRSPDKWVSGGREALDDLWNEASQDQTLRKKQANWRPLSRRSIIFWASRCSPERFRELSRNSYYSALGTYIYKYGGCLAHAMVAEVLHMILSERFAVDAIVLPDGKSRYVWLEFVSAGQQMRPGEVWKWRREANPDELHRFISTELVEIAELIAKEVAEKQKDAAGEVEAKYYKSLGTKLAASIVKLYDDGFKTHVIDQARYQFRRRGFLEVLDKDADILGVANGILRLASSDRPSSQLISSYHEWPVSRFTTVRYRPFDPTEPWTVLLLDAMKKIVPELDMRVWFMMFLSTGLYHGLKDPVMLFLVGSGRNAKTFAARMAAKVLGDYASKLQISLLTSEREDASKPNSAFMRLKDRGLGYFEESNKCEVLNTSRLKEMVNPGEVTASEKHGKQDVFDNTATPLSLSNFDFIVETKDDGTWRRIRHYRAKAKFCPQPDPNNPYEHKDDRRFINEYVNDPDCQSAFLSILVHFWERLQKEYGGDIASVGCPTLERETEVFRNSQDVLNRFITERIVASPKCPKQYPMSVIAAQFCDWYQSNIESSSRRYVATEVIGDLENSSLSRFLTTAPNGMRVISGCRYLTGADVTEHLQEGESFIGARGKIESQGVPRFGPNGEPEPEVWWEWQYVAPAEPEEKASFGDIGPLEVVSEADMASLAGKSGMVGDGRGGHDGNEYLREDQLMSDGRLRRTQEQRARLADEHEQASQMASVLTQLTTTITSPPVTTAVQPGARIVISAPMSAVPPPTAAWTAPTPAPVPAPASDPASAPAPNNQDMVFQFLDKVNREPPPARPPTKKRSTNFGFTVQSRRGGRGGRGGRRGGNWGGRGSWGLSASKFPL